VSLAPLQRQAQLKELAQQGNQRDQHQARFLLAADLVQRRQGKAALKWLQGLDRQYEVLAGEVLVLQAQAHTLEGQQEKAQATWLQILKRYPQDPAAAEALYALGKEQPRYWEQAIAKFPAHPRTIEIVQERLQQTPNQRRLLLLIAEHGLYLPTFTVYLQRLSQTASPELTPQDWQTIAFGYWEKQAYMEGGLAYAKAPSSAQNAYRTARGLQLGGEKNKAIAAYRTMVAEFPQSEETPTALMKLAELMDQKPDALNYLDQAIQLGQDQQRPQVTAQAMQLKVRWLQERKQVQAAAQIQTALLRDYGQTPAVAVLRWELAREQAKAQNWAAARDLALKIRQQNPESELAAAGTFWAGKWSQRLGNTAALQDAFEHLWQFYPDSYYAWRAAALADWPVGDFKSVRSLQPQIRVPTQRLPLAAGSSALQELYQLGQAQAAWERWQWEFQTREAPSLAEQLTDGLLRVEVGDYFDGIFMLRNLRDRAEAEPKQQGLYQQWRGEQSYGYALYPLAFLPEIIQWSQERAINPLLVLGLIRQESQFLPTIRSVAGAVGLMQVLPETATWIGEKINLKTYDLESANDNINLGTWYLDYTHRTYREDSMLAIASYNAGPGNVDAWVKELPLTDVDEFVESIPFPETNSYVKLVLGNYWNYLRLYDPAIAERLRQYS
jgi:soluble lytic murein transglycosylase